MTRTSMMSNAPLTCAALLVVCSAVAACSEPATEGPPVLRAVRYTVVSETQEDRQQIFSGSLAAGNQSQLSFQVGGRIQKLPVRAGQRLKKGAILAELDPTDFELQLREARANVAQARAQSENANSDYQRIRRLYETRGTSQQDLDSARTGRDTARSAYIAAQETLEQIKRQLGYTKLRAPAGGTVNAVTAEVNEVVSPGQPIVLLQVGEELEASVDVPEAFVQLISIGDPAKVEIKALSATVDGVVQEIGVAERGSGVFPVTIKLTSDPEKARPGMVAEVTLTPQQEEQAIPEGFKLPLTAIGEDRDGSFVFRVEGEPGGAGKVVRQPIKIGRLSADGIYVLEGVSEGQRVVTAGVSRIQDGLQVMIPAQPSQGETL